jgi:uncharacterized protein
MNRTPLESTEAAPLDAIAGSQRVQALDALRGLALLGIILVNILDYSPRPASAADRLTGQFTLIVADGSFYPLFSLLFGIGFAVFLERAAARGANGVLLYARRVAVLLLIAVLQIVLLEDRNILVRYAFLALPLLLFWRASARWCFTAALICFVLTVVRGPIDRAYVQREMHAAASAAALRAGAAADRKLAQARRAAEQQAVATKSFIVLAAYRLRWQVPNQLRWSSNIRRNPTLLHILSMFLLGAGIWRSRMFADPWRYRRRLRHVLVWGALIGVAGNIVLSVGRDGGPISLLVGRPVTTMAITLFANTSLTLVYFAAIVLLLSSPRTEWQRRFVPIGLVGRMALTNYLWQSVAMSLLFLPYGFRLDGKLPLWACSCIGLAIFLSHLPLSAWWLARYRFGPAEWAWRSLTYGRFQPMRLAPDPVGVVA